MAMAFDMNVHVGRHTSRLERAPRTSRACGLCHSRKVKCDIGPTRPQCSNCQRDAQECRQRPRQRRGHPLKATMSSWKSPDQPAATAQPAADAGRISRTTTTTAPPRAAPLQVGEEPRPPVNSLRHQQTQSRAQGAAQEENTEVHDHGPSPSVLSLSSISSSYEGGHMERSTYMAPDNFRAEDGSEIDYVVPPPPDATEQIAMLQNAFKFPPRAIRDSLFENFWTYCYVWDPIVDRSQVIGVELDKISPLLLQTIFLAGSQMISPSQPRTFASPQEYYTRAKTLFWLDYEKDPMDRLIASSLMHWWNPHGPERVSTNTSSFWCRITVSLAQQMGLHSRAKAVPDESLRRRLWWSIVARDCLISVAHGRPQAIALEDCDVPLPTLDDFPGAPLTGSFFIAYVELSLIIGRFTQKEIRKGSSNDSLTGIEDCLYRWTKNLPEILRPSYNADRPTNPSQPLRTYNLESRQLNVLYLTTNILLRRSRNLDGPFPTAAVVAASTMAGVFEDFLARDEVRFLGPAFSFHLLAASIALLSCYKYPDLWELAQEDLKILNQAQEEMKKRWPSAIGSLSSFDRMFKLTVATQMKVTSTCNCSLTSYEAGFFEICDMTLCRMYAALVQKPVINNGRDTRDMAMANADAINPHAPNPPAGGGLLKPRGIPFYSQEDHLNQTAGVELEPPDPGEVMSFDRMFQEEAGQANDTIGDWLFWNQLALDGN